MNGDIKQPGAREEQSPPMPAGKKKSGAPVKISLVTLGFFIAICAFVIGLAIAFSFIKIRDKAPNTTALAAGVHCDSWSETPAGFQAIIESSAAKFSIRPALLAAIYKQENGRDWRPNRWAGTEPWPVSPAPAYAAGPFQFIPPTWAGEISKTVVRDKCGSLTKDDINNKEKASCVAAYYISDKLKNSGISNDTMTEKEQDITDVAVAYTSSFDYFDSWKKSGRDPSKLDAQYLDYHTNVWATFQDLNQGCQSYSATATLAGMLPIQHLSQLDPRWKDTGKAYFPATGSIGGGGCGATSATMVINYLNNKPVYQGEIEEIAKKFYDARPSGVNFAAFNLAVFKDYGITGKPIDQSKIADELAINHPVIMHFTGYGRASHYVVIKSAQDSEYYITADPSGKDLAKYPKEKSKYKTTEFYAFNR